MLQYPAKSFRNGSIILRISQFLNNLLKPFAYGLHFFCQVFQLYLHHNKTINFTYKIAMEIGHNRTEIKQLKKLYLRRSFQTHKVLWKI